MPIIVKDFTWTQSESKVCINLPLKGTNASKLDILKSLQFCKVINDESFEFDHENYEFTILFEKVSYPPFIFECWFNDLLTDEECVAVVNNGIISLQFNKAEKRMWDDLFHSDYGNLH
jgi:hypothetical protein